jgi:hypothetical protein
LILEALGVAEKINEYLPLPPHLMGTIFEDLQIISVMKSFEEQWKQKEGQDTHS